MAERTRGIVGLPRVRFLYRLRVSSFRVRCNSIKELSSGRVTSFLSTSLKKGLGENRAKGGFLLSLLSHLRPSVPQKRPSAEEEGYLIFSVVERNGCVRLTSLAAGGLV